MTCKSRLVIPRHVPRESDRPALSSSSLERLASQHLPPRSLTALPWDATPTEFEEAVKSRHVPGPFAQRAPLATLSRPAEHLPTWLTRLDDDDVTARDDADALGRSGSSDERGGSDVWTNATEDARAPPSTAIRADASPSPKRRLSRRTGDRLAERCASSLELGSADGSGGGGGEKFDTPGSPQSTRRFVKELRDTVDDAWSFAFGYTQASLRQPKPPPPPPRVLQPVEQLESNFDAIYYLRDPELSPAAERVLAAGRRLLGFADQRRLQQRAASIAAHTKLTGRFSFEDYLAIHAAFHTYSEGSDRLKFSTVGSALAMPTWYFCGVGIDGFAARRMPKQLNGRIGLFDVVRFLHPRIPTERLETMLAEHQRRVAQESQEALRLKCEVHLTPAQINEIAAVFAKADVAFKGFLTQEEFVAFCARTGASAVSRAEAAAVFRRHAKIFDGLEALLTSMTKEEGHTGNVITTTPQQPHPSLNNAAASSSASVIGAVPARLPLGTRTRSVVWNEGTLGSLQQQQPPVVTDAFKSATPTATAGDVLATASSSSADGGGSRRSSAIGLSPSRTLERDETNSGSSASLLSRTASALLSKLASNRTSGLCGGVEGSGSSNTFPILDFDGFVTAIGWMT